MKKLNANKTQSLRETTDNDPWNKKLKIAMETYNITEENLAGKTNSQMKQIMKSKVNNHTKETIIANSANKSKVKHIYWIMTDTNKNETWREHTCLP